MTKKQRAIAAVADHDRSGGLSADRATVATRGGNRPCGQLFEKWCKLLVYSVFEAVLQDGITQRGELFGRVRELSAGKKYDFHHHRNKKMSNFTEQI